MSENINGGEREKNARSRSSYRLLSNDYYVGIPI